MLHHLCQPGYEGLLARELAAAGRRTGGQGPGWAGEDAPGPEAGDPAFAHLTLEEPAEVRGASVRAQAQGLLDAFALSLQGERIDSAWPRLFLAAAEVPGLGRRGAAVEKLFAELLQRKLPRIARLAAPGAPAGTGPRRGFFVWFAGFDRVLAARAARLHGARRMADDPAAPSRSYLKVEEAYGVLGRAPVRGETVVDLGAAPGGWSYSAARRGARVIAVDNGPLKAGAREHAGIEHRRADAFGFAPPGAAADWLFCDLVEDPRRVLREIVEPWLARGWCRSFVVNLKFGRVDPIELLAELRAPASPLSRHAPGARIRHLYHDREEFTLLGGREAPLRRGRRRKEWDAPA